MSLPEPGKIYFVRYDEDWITQGAVLTANSERTGYEAPNVATDDPSEPWWANSGTATLTATFSSPGREIGLIGIIMNNADDARTITIGGVTGVTGVVGEREESGYPRDLAIFVDPPQTVMSLTISISGNTNDFAIGRVVAGIRREITGFLDGMTVSPTRPQISDPGVPEYGHDIRYDVSVEQWKIEGRFLMDFADYGAMHEFNSGALYGFHPQFVVYDDEHFPPVFARVLVGPAVTKEGHMDVPLTLQTVSRGLEVFGV